MDDLIRPEKESPRQARQDPDMHVLFVPMQLDSSIGTVKVRVP